METKTIDLSDRFYTLIAILVVAVAVSYISGAFYSYKTLPQNYPNQLTVSGEGKAFVKPDIAQATFGMETTGFKSQDVVDKNNQVMNSVIKSIKGLGVDDKDIQTTMYNLNPIYDYTENGRVFKGYSLQQQVRVKIRNFDNISSILDKAVANGANTVGDLQFTVDDSVKSQAEARAKAIEQAKQKAMSIASQSGLKIDKLINVVDGNQGYPQPIYSQGLGGVMADKSTAPQIQTGQMEVNSNVTLTYLLK